MNVATRVVFALALGMVLNLLVALSCLCYAPLSSDTPWNQRGTGGDDGVGVPDNTLVRKTEYLDLGFGVRAVGVEHYWVMPRTAPDQRYPHLNSVQVESIRAGWPLTAVQSGEFDISGARTFAAYRAAAGAAVSRSRTHDFIALGGIGAADRLMPDQIAPVGFAANTILYSSVVACGWLAVVRARGALRRRAGRCESCTYPVADLPRCPECGRSSPAMRGRSASAFTRTRRVDSRSRPVSVSLLGASQ